MKALYYVIGIITALTGILAIVCLTVELLLVQPHFLNKCNEKYDIANQLSMESVELEQVVDTMVSYVKGGKQDAQVIVFIDGEKTEFFNEKELIHLTDVQKVLKLIRKIDISLFVISFLGVVVLLWKRKSKILFHSIYIAWGILLFLSAGIGIVAAKDINQIINGFHELFFANDLWMLDLSVDRSLWMFQEGMYTDALICIAAIIAGVCALSNGLATFVLTRKKWRCYNYENKRGKRE